MKNKHQQGLSLIETVVAIGVLLVGLMGGILLANNSLKTITFSRHLFEANQFATEGIEVVRAVRDSNWLKQQSWDTGLQAGAYRLEFDGTLNTMILKPLAAADIFDIHNLPQTLKNKTSIFYSNDIDRPHFTQDETKGLPETVFYRQIEISDNVNSKTIKSIVVVPRGSEFRIVHVEEELYNWKQ